MACTLMGPRPHLQLILGAYGPVGRSAMIEDIDEVKSEHYRSNAPEQNSGSHPRLLDHQDCRNHSGRDRRRYRHHDAEFGATSPEQRCSLSP
jgi:hypothetical protein